jgi:hypothetical protein
MVVRRLLFLLLFLCLATGAGRVVVGNAAPKSGGGSDTARAAEFDATVKPFLEKHCYTCHGARKQEADLNLATYKTAAAIAHDPDKWDEVLLKLRTGEMPPEDDPRPDATELDVIVEWLEREVERLDRIATPDPGRVTARRLNRSEYNNTVRDLLGVDLRPADDFPQDDAGYGFDNIGDVLSVSPFLTERYVAAAERLTRTALFGVGTLKPSLARLQSSGRRIAEKTAVPAAYDITGFSLPNAFHATHRVPVTGEYDLRVYGAGVRPLGSEPVEIVLYVDGRQIGSQVLDPVGGASFESDRQDLGGKMREFRVRLTAGEHWFAGAIPRLYEGLPVEYDGPNPSKRPPPPPPVFTPPPKATPERIARMKKAFEERLKQKAPSNSARVGFIEVVGPYNYERGPSRGSLAKVYTCGHRDTARLRPGPTRHGASCGWRIVSDFARRAFRRPVTARELEPYVALVRNAQREGDSLDEGVAVALQALLVSPDFLFRIERGPSIEARHASPFQMNGTVALSQHELASRLSYFLWSSMPDDALLRAADKETLRQPAVLAGQVRRMLSDPKSQALVENFGGQWLQFRGLESVAPDRERFPDFEDYLRLSMRRETELFFEDVVRNDRSILAFIEAPYSFLNERLARHYGVSGVTGPEFRRVDLSITPRRGVLSHGSVLTVTSYSTRTSPVLRGKFILENILNAPPPDPPPGVASIDQAPVAADASVRQRLEAHRTDATCAACHRRMDPLGFALENYDPIGAWRTQDGKQPVDAAGRLPDGRIFRGPEDLTNILASDRQFFARALTEKLLTYALGRGVESYDRSTVRNIARRVAANGYQFSTLVLEIVNSAPFQMRRGPGGGGAPPLNKDKATAVAP